MQPFPYSHLVEIPGTVTYKGLQYPLLHYPLQLNDALGVSNCIVDSRAEVILHQGRALVIVQEQ